MRKGGITKVNLQWFLHHQETPQNLISTAVLIFQVGIVVACMHMRITGALWAKRGERGILREARDEGSRKK